MSFIKAKDLGKNVLDSYNAAMEAKDMQEKAGIENRNKIESYDINTDTLNSHTPSEYEKNRAAYIAYLLMCVRLGDWHGVSDAANDLRVLEAKEMK